MSEIVKKIPGIEYEITTTAGRKVTLSFIHKREGRVFDGITNEDLLSILRDRLTKQSETKIDRYTTKAIWNITEAHRQLEERGHFMKRHKEKKFNSNKS